MVNVKKGLCMVLNGILIFKEDGGESLLGITWELEFRVFGGGREFVKNNCRNSNSHINLWKT